MALNNNPILLCIECSEKRATLLLKKGEEVTSFKLDANSQQSAQLIPLLSKLFKEANFEADSLTDIAVHVGPGSATGLRMGIAMVQAINLVYPQITIHAIPLEALALTSLNKSDTHHKKAMLLSNAFGGSIFMQHYTFTERWVKVENIKIVNISDLQNFQDEQLILADLGPLKEKKTWPEKWFWEESNFITAENILCAVSEKKDYNCSIENLDVRYLKATSAELNWEKNGL